MLTFKAGYISDTFERSPIGGIVIFYENLIVISPVFEISLILTKLVTLSKELLSAFKN